MCCRAGSSSGEPCNDLLRNKGLFFSVPWQRNNYRFGTARAFSYSARRKQEEATLFLDTNNKKEELREKMAS